MLFVMINTLYNDICKYYQASLMSMLAKYEIFTLIAGWKQHSDRFEGNEFTKFALKWILLNVDEWDLSASWQI